MEVYKDITSRCPAHSELPRPDLEGDLDSLSGNVGLMRLLMV